MDIQITVRHIGKKRADMTAVSYPLTAVPHTLRELIALLARTVAEGFNARLLAGESCIRPIAPEALADMEAVGKLAFGVNYGTRRADPDKAAADALLAFEDGLFRVLHNGEELTDPDAPLALAPTDEFTFIRLTLLTGSLW